MTISFIILSGGSFLAIAMTAAWELVHRTKNGGLADIVWTFALGLVAIFFSMTPIDNDALSARHIIAAALIAVWMFKLGFSLWGRNVGGKEDARYTEFREKWGKRFLPYFFGMMMVQAFAALLLALGVVLAAHNPMAFGWLDGIGIVWLLVALAGSFAADRQLARFKRDKSNKGKICDAGLWSRSRHPNYFFEVMFWAGWPMLAISGGWLPGLWALIAPAFIYWLLRYVSGEPMVEKLMARHYGKEFQDYCKQVPPFWLRLSRS